MKVILKKSVEGIGTRGDIINVSVGYARNYIFPKQIGRFATEKDLQNVSKRTEDIAKKDKEKVSKFKNIANKINGETIEMFVKVGKDGSVFESIHERDFVKEVCNKIKQMGFDKVSEGEIKADFKPIKEIGEFDIKTTFGSNSSVSAVIKLVISSK